jgi:hypothetical protein
MKKTPFVARLCSRSLLRSLHLLCAPLTARAARRLP